MKFKFIILALFVGLLWWVAGTPAIASTSTPAEPVTVLQHVDAIWPCAYFKPHTGDSAPVVHAWNNESNPFIDTADCSVDHPGGGIHLYCVTEWHHDGAGNPISPPAYTWQGGWC